MVVSGGKSEKLASGLVEPFIAHLKFAEDHIPKGGYSITLRPPHNASFWFTKATFQRFVRFVSTPEVLERFIRLEQEIVQIESSIDSKSFSKSSSQEVIPAADSASTKESSKYHLQCVLDTRKAMLRKEQAMAYARATVAGFEVEQMDDLICFAHAFGASRLREACVDFIELYKQKHTDCQWMDEVIAMKASSQPELSYSGNSGVVLACENGSSFDTSSDSKESQHKVDGVGDNNNPSTKFQHQMPWPNQIPPYMYNFHGPTGHPMPFPAGMHPYYPSHMHWPQTVDGYNGSKQHHKSSKKKKEKVSKSHAADKSSVDEEEEDDEEITSSGSDSETDSDESVKQRRRGRKHKKKSSKTVVIRNINYITSKNNKSDESASIGATSSSVDESSIKQQVDDAISLLEQGHNNIKPHKHSKRGDVENWDAFQSILMSREDEEKQSGVSFNGKEEDPMAKTPNGFELKKTMSEHHFPSDGSVVERERYREEENGGHIANKVDFSNGEQIRPSLKSGDDWFLVKNSWSSEGGGAKDVIFEKGDSLGCDRTANTKTLTSVDDSFIIHQSHSAPEEHWKTDINLEADQVASSQSNPPSSIDQPNDLCLVVARDHSVGPTEASRMTELGYEIEASFMGRVNKTEPDFAQTEKSPPVSDAKKSIKKDSSSPSTKTPSKSKLSPGYLSRNKPDSLSKSKKASPTNKLAVQKSKLEREEEARKKMEELVIERQKRIAERTSACAVRTSGPKKAPTGSKTATSKPEKHRLLQHSK